jgi:flagellar motor switch protein FliG
LQRFFDGLPAEKVTAIMSNISTIQATSLDDFEKLKAHLTLKAEKISSNLFSEKDKVASIQLMISGIGSPVLQVDLLGKLRTESQNLYYRVRPEIFVVPDLKYLSSRCRTLVVQAVDADTLGAAVSDFNLNFDEFTDGMPPAYQSIFNDARRKRFDVSVQAQAWKKICAALQELQSTGLMSRLEIASAIRRSEEELWKSDGEGKQEIDTGPELETKSAA